MTLSLSTIVPVVYSPGGTYTVPPPRAWQASTASCTGRVAFWVRTPVAPWSRTLQTLASGAGAAGSEYAGAPAEATRAPRKRAVAPAARPWRRTSLAISLDHRTALAAARHSAQSHASSGTVAKAFWKPGT